MDSFSFTPKTYQEIMNADYDLKLKKNPSYSLRAYARDLGISSAQLSAILLKKKGLSLSSALKIANKMGLSVTYKDFFLDLVQATHARNKTERALAAARLASRKNINALFLQEDLFKVVSDWQHFAILELTTIDHFKNNPEWISKKLGISLELCRESVERLFRTKLLKEKDGKWSACSSYISGPDEIKSSAVKKFHQQAMEKASTALENQGLTERDFGSVHFTIDKEDLPEAKKILKEFRKSFSSHFRKKIKRNSLYALNIQPFRLDQDLD